jgi:hypothetical protein
VEGTVLHNGVRKRRLLRGKSENRATEKNGPFHRIVRLEIYDFGFEMQESSDFEILPTHGVSSLPYPAVQAREQVDYLISFLFANSVSVNKREK